MSSLIKAIEANHHLEFVDVESGRTAGSDSLYSIPKSNSHQRKLAFLYVDNSIDSILIYWSFFKSDHAIALLSPDLNPEFKLQLEEIYQPGFIFDFKRNPIPGYELISINENVNIHQSTETTSFDIHPQIKVLLSTSGTTGSPKFVKLSEENLYQNALSIINYLPIDANDNTPLNLPIYYSYGLSVLHSNCIAGGKIFCTNSDVLNQKFWEEFEKYGYTSLAGVPFVYEMLFRIGFTKKHYNNLKYLTQAGGKLNAKMVSEFSDYAAKNGVRFYVMYGQTEASARMSFLDPEAVSVKTESIGKPVINGKFTIDIETQELIYEGPNVFGGYAESLSDLGNFESDLKLSTGDLARVDEDGFYYITGRMKRFIKIFGSRVNLDEIESILKSEFTGSSFTCTGINDKFLLIGNSQKHITKENVISFLHQKLNIHPSMIRFQEMESIPLTPNGKVDYNKIIELYEAK